MQPIVPLNDIRKTAFAVNKISYKFYVNYNVIIHGLPTHFKHNYIAN